jgi:hypothetical protein
MVAKAEFKYLLVHPNHFGTCRSRSLQVDIDFGQTNLIKKSPMDFKNVPL